jgi:hypothetical protein
MNSTIASTLGPRALDVGSLNYFEAFEIFLDIKTFYKFLVKFKNLIIWFSIILNIRASLP